MKKVVSWLLVLAVLFALPCNAFAAESSEQGNADIEKYFSITVEGTIYFDELSATEDGIDPTMIVAVSEQIDMMNRLILEENGYVTEDYSVVVYLSRARAVGESKIVTHWYGVIEIWLDSDQAAELLEGMEPASTGSQFWDTLIGLIPGIGTGIAVGNLQTMIYRANLERAESSKTGIIIYVYTTDPQSILFVAQ